MPTVNLGNHSLGGPATVLNLVFDITTTQSVPKQEADRVAIGKPLTGTGEIGITTKARFSVQGISLHTFGIKQIASQRFGTAEYSGLKNIDGSIVEGTSTLNGTVMLDVAVFADVASGVVSAPHAPFYAENPAFIRPATQVELTVKDAPGGSYPFEKRNHITDRLNFLDSVDQTIDFATFLVVKLPDSTHHAIAGFRWSFSASVQVSWSKGKPTASGSVAHRFQEGATRAALRPTEVDIFDNPRLTFLDSIVARVNRAKSAANATHVGSPIGASAPRKIDGGGYSIEQFETFNNPKLGLNKTPL